MTTQSGLFDSPGPRGRLIIRVISVLSVVAFAGFIYWVVVQFDSHGQLAASKWEIFGHWNIDKFLLDGLGLTLKSALVAVAITLVFALLIALGRLSRRKWLRILCATYVEVFRSIPTLIVVLVFLLALPDYGLRLPVYWELTIPLIIAHSAKVAEVYRAGILSMERGQAEAAYSLGLNYSQTMVVIILPQALRRLAPSIVSELVAMLKSTSLGYVVSYGELLYSGKILGEYTQNLVQTYIVIALVYVVINASLSWFARRLEARQSRGLRRPKRRGRDQDAEAATSGLLVEAGTVGNPKRIGGSI